MAERTFQPAKKNPKHDREIRDLTRPRPGLYKLRRRSGVYVAARILYQPTPDPCDPGGNPLRRERSYFWSGEIDARPDPEGSGVFPTAATEQIWIDGEPITILEYDYLLKDRAWCREWAPQSPEANPDRKVDLATMPTKDLF